MQVCSHATPKHCSTGQGRKASPLFSAALQTRLTARLCHCNHTYGDLLFIQVCSHATPEHCSTGQGKKASPLFSAALQNRLTACLCHWKHTYGHSLFIQVCSDATPKHCSAGQGRKASPLFSAALQTGLTACLCHWNHTCGDLLFIQGCSDAAPKHCSTGRAEKTPHCSVLLCKTGPQQACGAAVTPMEICSSYRGAVKQHQSTAALAGQKRLPTVHCCFAKQADSMFMPLESHLWRFAVHAGVQ